MRGGTRAIPRPSPKGGPSPAGLAAPAFLPDRLERPVVVLDDLGHQFLEPLPGLLQDPAAGRGGPVVLAAPPVHDLRPAAQVAQPLQQVERGVERALAQAVAMPD